MDATPKFTKFGFGVTTESLPKFIPPRELTSTHGSTVTLQRTNLLKLGLGPLFLSNNPLMEVLSFWALLIHWGPAGPIGLKIFCVPVRVRELEVLLKIWIGEFNLAVATVVLTSHGVEPYLPVRLTPSDSRKCARHCALCLWKSPLRAPSGVRPKSLGFLAHPLWSYGQSDGLRLGWSLEWTSCWIIFVGNVRW